jgi:hypothetical protein
MTNVVYLEQQPTYGILPAGGVLTAIILLATPLVDPPAWVYAITLSLALIIIFVVWHFNTLTISIEGNTLRFGFGWFQKSVLIDRIAAIRLVDVRFRNTFPIFRARFESRRTHFVARSGKAVEIAVTGRTYVVSSDHADRLSEILEQARARPDRTASP